MTGSAALADDVVQEVFVLLHRRSADLDDRLGIRTWLYRAVLNVVRQRRRGDRRYSNALAGFGHAPSHPAGGPEGVLSSRQQGLQVRACVARLSEAQQEVFVLFELEEVDGAEIAAILEIPVNTVWSRLRLARLAFREEWARTHGAST